MEKKMGQIQQAEILRQQIVEKQKIKKSQSKDSLILPEFTKERD